jgi:hypothetical protein
LNRAWVAVKRDSCDTSYTFVYTNEEPEHVSEAAMIDAFNRAMDET